MEPLLPARMLNEFVYCPRLFALEWLDGEWADSADTVTGKTVHRRVDRPDDRSVEEAPATRSVTLGDETLGLIATIDIVEASDGEFVPVDYKKGALPPVGAWEPEKVQLCAQGLLLRAHGYTCSHGILYFAASKRRVTVPFDEALVEMTLRAREEALKWLGAPQLPPPLVDSPRCHGCSLVGICLPDEHNHLQKKTTLVRPLVSPREDAVPLYVQLRHGKLGKDHEEIVVWEENAVVTRARIQETSQVVLMGNVSISTPLLHVLAQRDIPVFLHSFGGWMQGMFWASSGHNVRARIAQHQVAADPLQSLRLARAFITSKISNCRVLLRRNSRSDGTAESLLRLKDLAGDASEAPSIATLLGIEGAAARIYFQALPAMLRGALGQTFDFEGRNRRPPKDPINAMLSFAYACLVREATNALRIVGLDPFVGFLHQPRPGKPALALDLMEEFRPVIADSVVLRVINNGELSEEDFIVRPTGTTLSDPGRRAFLRAFDRRMDEETSHPLFETRWSYRRLLTVQARLLARTLTGELPSFPEYRIR